MSFVSEPAELDSVLAELDSVRADAYAEVAGSGAPGGAAGPGAR